MHHSVRNAVIGIGVATMLTSGAFLWRGMHDWLADPTLTLHVRGKVGAAVTGTVTIQGTWDDPDAELTEAIDGTLPLDRSWPARRIEVDLLIDAPGAGTFFSSGSASEFTSTSSIEPGPTQTTVHMEATSGPGYISLEDLRWAVAILLGGLAGIGVLLWRTRRARLRAAGSEPLAG